MYTFLANATVIVHVAFVVFAVFGGIAVVYRVKWAWIHIPAALWAAVVELMDWTCPLTPLENFFREKSGMVAYRTDFIDHYVVPVLYPDSLTRRCQVFLGLAVVAFNLSVYAWAFFRRRR
ncbi:MAG: hypothetical protein CSYNP_03886 [Syntrophus sp. SKADARSKE-3]|nr:hypothetical protein [Syntrophus sp. SKADARSKE-3]